MHRRSNFQFRSHIESILTIARIFDKLTRHIEARGWEMSEFSADSTNQHPFCPTADDRQLVMITPSFIRAINRVVTKDSLAKITAHSARRTMACIANHALHPDEARSVLGWAPGSMSLQTYTLGQRLKVWPKSDNLCKFNFDTTFLVKMIVESRYLHYGLETIFCPKSCKNRGNHDNTGGNREGGIEYLYFVY